MSRKAALFVNLKSRRGKEWFTDAKAKLRGGGIELVSAESFRDPKRISRAVEAAIKEGIELIILGGGDGTFSANVRHFVGSNAVLGVLPFGTGNAFARDLGIEPSVDEACKVILAGHERSVDLGVAGDDYFVNVATVGLTVRIAEELTNENKRRFGRLAYVLALIRGLISARPFKARLITDEGKHEFETLQVVIGSGRFHAGPFPISPGANIADGVLSIYALASTNKWSLLRLALKMPGGHHVELQDVPAFAARGGTLETSPVQRVNVDGEIEMQTPLRFGIAPGALRVLVGEVRT